MGKFPGQGKMYARKKYIYIYMYVEYGLMHMFRFYNSLLHFRRNDFNYSDQVFFFSSPFIECVSYSYSFKIRGFCNYGGHFLKYLKFKGIFEFI